MRRVVLPAAVMCVLVAIAVFFMFRSGSSPASESVVDYSTVMLTKPYTNTEFAFSLNMPGTFEARALSPDESGATTILIESSDKADGIQIIVSPFDEDLAVLTQERIQQDVPDLTITDSQPVEIGANHTGLAFKSDNEAFSGASREVWFVFRGHLFQISTYERLDPLLKKIFSTWQFL